MSTAFSEGLEEIRRTLKPTAKPPKTTRWMSAACMNNSEETILFLQKRWLGICGTGLRHASNRGRTFLATLQKPPDAENEGPEIVWSQWLAMEDWMVASRASETMNSTDHVGNADGLRISRYEDGVGTQAGESNVGLGLATTRRPWEQRQPNCISSGSVKILLAFTQSPFLHPLLLERFKTPVLPLVAIALFVQEPGWARQDHQLTFFVLFSERNSA